MAVFRPGYCRVGVIATAAIVGAAAVLLFSTSWARGLLIGGTDAAAVSALLHLRRLQLRARVAGTLEVESGINDPSRRLLAVLLVDLLLAPLPVAGSHILALLAREVAGGAALGIGGGYLLLALINRLEATSGSYPILALAGATALFNPAPPNPEKQTRRASDPSYPAHSSATKTRVP